MSSLQRHLRAAQAPMAFRAKASEPCAHEYARDCSTPSLEPVAKLVVSEVRSGRSDSSAILRRRPLAPWARTSRSAKCQVAALPSTMRFRSTAGGSVLDCEDQALSFAEALKRRWMSRRSQSTRLARCLVAPAKSAPAHLPVTRCCGSDRRGIATHPAHALARVRPQPEPRLRRRHLSGRMEIDAGPLATKGAEQLSSGTYIEK